MNSKQLHSLKFPSILFETISTFLELNHPMGRRKLRCFWLPLALTKKREKWACDVSHVYWSNLVAYSLPIRHHLSYISHILDWQYQEYIDDNIWESIYSIYVDLIPKICYCSELALIIVYINTDFPWFAFHNIKRHNRLFLYTFWKFENNK